jgi:hypothetical protein
MPMPADVTRVVALGASNLTRGFQTVVSTARANWGPNVEVVAALGHGRSYGAHSRFVIRTLPGILESGVWRHLESLPAAPTRALITDVGNDILYGFSARQTLAWAAEVVERLLKFTDDIVLTDLPVVGIRRLSQAKFLMFRSILVPSCRLSLEQILQTARQVNDGLAALAAARGIRFFRLNPEWYTFDPIHIRPSQWRPAWEEILGRTLRQGGPAEPGGPRESGGGRLEGLKLYFSPPERQWLFGMEQFTPQAGVKLPAGASVWLY